MITRRELEIEARQLELRMREARNEPTSNTDASIANLWNRGKATVHVSGEFGGN